MRALKYGHSATIQVDIGAGVNTGIILESSNTSVATVNAQGLVTPVVNPATAVSFNIIVREETSTIALASIDFIVVPAAVPQEKLDAVNNGTLVFTNITDTSGPVGGSLNLSYNGSQLVVGFVSPTDADSGIDALLLTIASTDLTDIRANKLNITGLSSPRYFNVVNGKIYNVTLRALNGDGLVRDITETFSIDGGWNVAAWNEGGFGL